MNEWQRREAELLARENAWYNSLPPFMKLVDNHLYFCIMYLAMIPFAFAIGLVFGLLL